MYPTNLDADGWRFRGDSLLDGEDSIDRDHFIRVRTITDRLAANEDERVDILRQLAELKENKDLDKCNNNKHHNISGYPVFQDQPHHATPSEYYGDGNDDNVSGNQHQGVTQ